MKLYKREMQGYNNGFIFKSFENYQNGKEICYIPEFIQGLNDYQEYVSGERGYTRQDFEKLCENTKIDSDYLFELVDWQHPKTLLSELLDDEEIENA